MAATCRSAELRPGGGPAACWRRAPRAHAQAQAQAPTLGCCSVESSASLGMMLTSSNRPVLYTLSMSDLACRRLYTLPPRVLKWRSTTSGRVAPTCGGAAACAVGGGRSGACSAPQRQPGQNGLASAHASGAHPTPAHPGSAAQAGPPRPQLRYPQRCAGPSARPAHLLDVARLGVEELQGGLAHARLAHVELHGAALEGEVNHLGAQAGGGGWRLRLPASRPAAAVPPGGQVRGQQRASRPGH
jgi:hypothetical protein